MTETLTVAQIRNSDTSTQAGAWLAKLREVSLYAAPNRAAAAAQLLRNITAVATETGEVLLSGDTVRGFHPVLLAHR